MIRAAVQLLIIATFLPSMTDAHVASSGFAYDGRCCNAYVADATGTTTGDCAPIPDSAVRIVADGFVVTLRPGDHPLVVAPFSEHIRYGQPMYDGADLDRDPSITALQASRDGRYHACIHPANHVRCLYFLPGGV